MRFAHLFRLVAFVALASFAATTVSAAAQATMDDRDIPWDVRTLSLDDAIAAIEAEPLLAPHRELIIDRAGLHSVSPRLLSLLLKYNEQIAAAGTADVAQVRFLIDAAIAATSKFFYDGRQLSGPVTESTSRNTEILAIDPGQRGLYAIANSLSVRPYDFNVDDLSRTLSDQLIAIRLMRGETGTALTASLGVTTGLLTTPTSILEFSRGCR